MTKSRGQIMRRLRRRKPIVELTLRPQRADKKTARSEPQVEQNMDMHVGDEEVAKDKEDISQNMEIDEEDIQMVTRSSEREEEEEYLLDADQRAKVSISFYSHIYTQV